MQLKSTYSVWTTISVLFIWTLHQPLVAYSQNIRPAMAYGFEEGSGTVTADSSGHSQTATLVNGPRGSPASMGMP
jgi:hypothetical protein